MTAATDDVTGTGLSTHRRPAAETPSGRDAFAEEFRRAHRRGLRRAAWLRALLNVTGVLLFLAVWEAVPRLGTWVNPVLLPPPSAVFDSFVPMLLSGEARGAGLGDPWLRLSGVHIAYGGDPAVACCARDNLPDTGWSGFVEQALTPADVREACFLAAEHDLRLHTIVSDRLHEVVPVLEAVNERYPLSGRRWVIEHIGRARLSDLEALKRLDVLVTTIPTYFLWKGGAAYLEEPDGGDLVVPHAHLLRLGIPTAIATDNIPHDPFFTLWSVCNRLERSSGRVIGPDQRLDAETALRLFTVADAALTFDEGWKGPLRPGFAADLAVLSENPTAIDPDRLRDLRCRLTLVGGRIVHREGL